MARTKKKAVKEHNLFLLYQVLAFDYEPSGALYEKQLSEEEKKLLKEAVEKSTLEDMFYFLAELVSYNSHYWKPHVVPFNVDTKENREWLKGLIVYLYSDENSYRKLSDSVFCNIYAEILRKDMSEKHLKEIEPVMNEIFGVDIKEFLYSNTNFLSNEQVKDLLETGYISTQELYEKNQRFLRKPLGDMDRKFLLDFLKDFCESRKWCFTEKEADFLQDVFKDSWIISLAYYNKDKETHFELFSEEEKELLLGLMCELCIRIPNIADIDDLMAGYIANIETRRIIGQDIADEWYQALIYFEQSVQRRRYYRYAAHFCVWKIS